MLIIALLLLLCCLFCCDNYWGYFLLMAECVVLTHVVDIVPADVDALSQLSHHHIWTQSVMGTR